MLLIVNFALNQVLSGGFVYMLELIRTLQMILHLPIMRIIIPSNVSQLFSIIIPIAMFDILDAEWTTELIFDFDEDKQDELQDQMLDQTIDIGYETHNSMLNLGSLAIFTSLWFFKLPFLLLAKALSGKFTTFGKIFNKMYKAMVFGELIAILIDAYFEFLISGYLQFKAPLYSENGETVSVIIGGVGLVLILGFI